MYSTCMCGYNISDALLVVFSGNKITAIFRRKNCRLLTVQRTVFLNIFNVRNFDAIFVAFFFRGAVENAVGKGQKAKRGNR